MKLREPDFRPFPLVAIEPQGWLRKQLKIQAAGLCGHLDEFWPDIKDSAWIGGSSEGWERMPYWLDGAIPLAWLVDDPDLKTRITGYIDYIVSHQHADGWLGPRVEDEQAAADLWSQALALKMLVGYYDAAGDDRVPDCVGKALRMLDRYIDSHPLANWGQFRWFEFLISIWWLYEKTNESWLTDLAVKLHAQGFNWQAFFQYWPLKEPTEKGRWNYAGHVVNNAMALKEGALWWRFTGEDSERKVPYHMLGALDRFHGMPTGVFAGDECLAGSSVIQGTELCAVVEFMYSLEWLVGTFGDPAFADRLEFITYNALPATFSPDMWAHQYDQQVNQIECSIRENRSWNTNGPDSNIFGLEPNYGCCTSNLGQGWPKFTQHLWMRTGTNGIAAVAYAPSRLDTLIDGVPVSIELETDYPFRQDLKFTVTTEKPIRFPLLLRIPAWAAGSAIDMDGEHTSALKEGTFHTIEQTWQGETTFLLTLPMAPRVLSRPNNAISISRGPLLYALAIGEDWRQINQDEPHRELPHADWEIYPTGPWNYALEIDKQTGAKDIVFRNHPMIDMPFSPENPPVSASLKGRRVDDWEIQNGSAAPTPNSPVKTHEPLEDVSLIPYGCTNLRVAEFPIVRREFT